MPVAGTARIDKDLPKCTDEQRTQIEDLSKQLGQLLRYDIATVIAPLVPSGKEDPITEGTFVHKLSQAEAGHPAFA